MSQELWANQAGTYSAELSRRAVFAQYARTAANSPGIIAGGLVAAGDLALSAPGSGLSVNVAVGEAIIGGNEGGAQGGYYGRNTASANLSVAANGSGNPRVDTVVATVADAGYTQPSDVGGTTNGLVLAVVTGTPTASASLANLLGIAAVPGSSLAIGYCLVPAGAANIITADLATVATVGRPQFAYLLPTSQTSTYTAKPGDYVACPSGTFTVTSPAAAKGTQFSVINYGSGVITVSAASGVIYGPGCMASGLAAISLGTPGATVTLASDGTNWLIVSGGMNTGWTAPTLINSWVNVGGAFETPAYLKDQSGFVRLKGFVKSGTSGTVAFVLPAGYRPGATAQYAVNASGPVYADCQIDSSGNVTLFTTNTASVSMSGVTFLAEN